ncbi:zinc finger, C4 type [Dictyocaulus viviparus]|uniref:Zinc finger, C4 type n=1 Tax=Dictyocaulus viviparus TaxID=29172 RepID=A0A0D8XC60_DICVI|nr:zinc finger, C4 type [Dictyocaulus viviparus]
MLVVMKAQYSDQRNACRFCRFQRCLNVGMEPDAIRPDRDIIGKQKNPRRKKLKREDSSLPSPGSDSPSPHEDVLVTFLVDVELQSMSGRAIGSPLSINVQRIKPDPDMDISSLFSSPFAYEHETYQSLECAIIFSISSSPHEDVLVTFLVDVELQSMSGRAIGSPLSINVQRIKPDPDMDISSLFSSPFAYEHETYQMGYAMDRVASVEQLASALRRYLLATVHWIEALFSLAQIDNVSEKVAVLKSVFAPYTILCQAARTAQVGGRSSCLDEIKTFSAELEIKLLTSQLSGDIDAICLCNRTTITRQPPRHLLETNLLANNLVPRILDDLVTPMRKLALIEAEIVVLSALVILDPGNFHFME